MKTLIGSKAIKHWFPDFPREPKDVDYIVTAGELEQYEKVAGIEYLRNPIFENHDFDVLPPNLLYTLKMSHLCWNINWEKHLFDVQFLRNMI